MFWLKQKIKNDIYISVCFTALFTALNTLSHIQKTITVSIRNDNPSYTADGYNCIGIIYTSLAISMWLSPSILVVIGRKATLILGASCASLMTSFYFENVLVTYVTSAITGIGSALLWTGQANYIVLNSKVGNVYQSISIFWMLLETSFIFGNAFVYFQFNDPTQPIDRPMRGRIALLLLGFVVVAIAMLFCLSPPMRKDNPDKKILSPLTELKKVYSIATNKIILISCILFVYTGLNVTFLSVLGASMGFSKYLSANSKEYAPLSGFVQGFGEFAGCSLSLLLRGGKTSKMKPVFTLGCIGGITAYVTAFLGLPDTAVHAYTDELPFVQLPALCLLAANVFVGMADACLHIEIYQFLGTLYPDDSAPAFAVFKFVRCLATAGSFYYSNMMGLHAQLVVILVFAVLGFTSYLYLTWFIGAKSQKNEESVTSFSPPNVHCMKNKYKF